MELDRSYFSLAVSPNGKTVFCGASDRSCVVELAAGKVLHRLTGRPWSVAITPDGKTLVASAGARLRVWDGVTGKEKHAQAGDFGHHAPLAVSPDGRLLASADRMMQEVSLWDTTNGRLVRQLPLKGEGGDVRHLSFSADGQSLSAAQANGFVQFWAPETGIEQRSLPLPAPALQFGMQWGFYQILVSPDGKRLTTLDRIYQTAPVRARVGVWDGVTGKLISEHYYPGEQRVWPVAGNSVIAVPQDSGLSVLAPDTGKVWFRLPDASPGGPITTSSDGRLLISQLNTPGMVGVWETVTGSKVAKLETGPINTLAMAGDNCTLVTAEEGWLRVWDVATGKELGCRQLGSEATGLILSPDGTRAITPIADGTALAWDLAAFPVAPLPPSERKATELWEDLLRDDAAAAYAAVRRLVGSPEGAVGVIRDRLKPVQPPAAEECRRLLAQLGAEDFQLREAAQRQLREYGERATGAIREALKGDVTPEQQRRMELLLQASAGGPLGPGEALRGVRAVWVLERIGSPEARRVLESLARGVSEAQLTREAKAALARVSQR
jgi:WD40 repeat protein